MNRAIAIILIGRNEGARLKASFESTVGRVERIVYVDIGSTDDSVAAARARGVEVVELDASTPFTAARARNAGVAALRGPQGELPEFLQFIDGDCVLEPDWLSHAVPVMRADARLGVVTGWRREIHPRRASTTPCATTSGTARPGRSWPAAATCWCAPPPSTRWAASTNR